MKISIFASVSAFTVTELRVARDVEEISTRRYDQLVDMMKHYNPQFDERKQFQYGCNCYTLGKLTKSCVFSSFELMYKGSLRQAKNKYSNKTLLKKIDQ